MCRLVTSVPADGYPGGRVTVNARPRTKCFGGGKEGQAAKNAKVLMQAITESSLVLSRHSVFLARTTLKERILHPKAACRPFTSRSSKCRVGISKDHCKTLAHIGISEIPTPASCHPLNRKKCPSSSPPCAAAQLPSQREPSQRVDLPSLRA